MNSITFNEERDEETCYGYCNEYQPHAVKRMFDYKNGLLYDMRWDKAGNLNQISYVDRFGLFNSTRHLAWTEDNRLYTVADERYYSYYAYDHTGQRTLKMTGDASTVDVNAWEQHTYGCLDHVTLYPSPYMVLTEQGYTKHYYAGTERVAARLGSGGLSYDATCVTGNGEVAKRSDELFWKGVKLLNGRGNKPEDFKEMSLVDAKGKEVDWLKKIDLDKLAMSWQLEAKLDPGKIHSVIDDNAYPAMLGNTRYENEPDVYFYHSDHLGGASWITDADGKAVQHLQYLPYGEPYVNQRISGYNERFTFTGKERDEETGYGYFGARYMDYTLMTSFISVDRYASKYPFISPYAYCAWNPIILTDPSGDTLYIPASTDANHGATKTCLISLLKRQKYSKLISVDKESGRVSVSATEEQLRNDAGLSLIYDLVNSEKKFFFEVSDDISSVYKDGKTHDMSENNRGVINASNGGLDSEYTHTFTPKEGYDGHVIIARSGEWKEQNHFTGKEHDIRASITFHELAENFYRTDQGIDYYGGPEKAPGGAHDMAIDREGITYRYSSIGKIPKATKKTPKSGYYYKKKHIL